MRHQTNQKFLILTNFEFWHNIYDRTNLSKIIVLGRVFYQKLLLLGRVLMEILGSRFFPLPT